VEIDTRKSEVVCRFIYRKSKGKDAYEIACERRSVFMRSVKTIAEMQSVCRDLRSNGSVLGFVPTMGALHEGHLSLVRRARSECNTVVASIFVNPLQFAPGEDFAKYPRTFEGDCKSLETERVDVLFAPDAAEMYPNGSVTTVTVSGVGDRLDGASRPGHFTGVATVVAKLFHIVGPTRAYFGQKDAAQLAVLRQMVRDLNFDVELIGCAIVRDADGLALSSRNKYLSAAEREQALVIHRTLLQLERMIVEGERQSITLVRRGMESLDAVPGVQVDYLAIVDANTLLPVTSADTGTLVAVAAYVGSTRLIDNFLVGWGSK
jgi:pantoate--beta-alanine ligase